MASFLSRWANLAVAAMSMVAAAVAQEVPAGFGKAWPELGPEGSPFKPIPEGYKFVHWDDMDTEESLGSYWLSTAKEWRFVEGDLDDGAGNVAKGVGPALFFKSSGAYKSRVRAPHTIALVKDLRVGGNFVLEVEMMQTGVETAHRDLCLFFGFEGPERFFYNHLGKRPDPHSSNVFKVDRKDRVRLGEVSKKVIQWGRGEWHRVRLECEWANGSGRVRTYFDDMETPHFDKRLFREAAGYIGLGSFDDAGAFRNLHVWAEESSKVRSEVGPFGGEIRRRLHSKGPQSGGLSIDGAGSTAISFLGHDYRVGMTRTLDGVVQTSETNTTNAGFFFDDGLDFYFDPNASPEQIEAARIAWGKQFQWVLTDAADPSDAAGLIGIDEAIVLENGLAVTAEPFSEPDYSSGVSPEPIYGVQLRCKPAKESRSRYLARRYRKASGQKEVKDPEGIWRWTTDIAGSFENRIDRRPLLVAVTPAGDPFSVHLDKLLAENEGFGTALARRYRCVRVDPQLIAGEGLRWPAESLIDPARIFSGTAEGIGGSHQPSLAKLEGLAMCAVFSGGGGLSVVQEPLTADDFLSRLRGR